MSLLWVPDMGYLEHTVEFFMRQKPYAWKRGEPFFVRGKGSGKGFIKVAEPKLNRYYKDLILHRFAQTIMNRDLLELFPWHGPVRVTIHSLFNPAVSSYYPGKQHLQRPDVDNLIKIVLDALTVPSQKQLEKYAQDPSYEYKIWAWKDDVQVMQIVSTKQFHKTQGTVVKLEFFSKIEKRIRTNGSKKVS